MGGTNDYRYDFQGNYSEKDGETGWNAFKLRQYNSRIGRWTGVDPKSQFFSSYEGLGNNPISQIDKDGGWLQEFKNWVAHGMWISNAGWNEYDELTKAGIKDIGYALDGNKVTGTAKLFFFKDDASWVSKYKMTTEDLFYTDKMTGRMYAVYPDLEFKFTGGLRFAEEIGGLGIDVNFFSVELLRHSFSEGTRSIFDGFKNYENFRFEQGIEIEAGIPFTNIGGKLEAKVEYNMPMTEITESINARLGALNYDLVYNAMTNEVSSCLGFKRGPSMGNIKGAYFIGGEVKFYLAIIPVANNDINAFMNAGQK